MIVNHEIREDVNKVSLRLKKFMYNPLTEFPVPKCLSNIHKRWLKEGCLEKTRSLRVNQVKVQLLVDASKSGWGAVEGKRIAAGSWSIEESQLHINLLEILAVKKAIQSLP